MDELEEPLPLEDVVPQDVVFGRRFRSEKIAKRLVHEQAVTVRPVDLESDGRMLEEPLQERSGVCDRIEASPLVQFVQDRDPESTRGSRGENNYGNGVISGLFG
jgi:hypothetical protein